MRNKLIILFAFVLVFSVFPQAVSADLIIPGTKSVNWCYEISNINDYPDYVFVFNEERVTGHGIINQGDCFGFYKNGLTSVYAIPKAEFNEAELNREFFEENNPILIKSNIQLVKFFVFYLNPFCNESLSDIFKKDLFNFIYLSNVLDWICWHNLVQRKDIMRIFNDFKKVSEKDSPIIVDHLTQRKTLLTEILTEADKLKKEDYRLYTYNWAMYKILLNNI